VVTTHLLRPVADFRLNLLAAQRSTTMLWTMTFSGRPSKPLGQGGHRRVYRCNTDADVYEPTAKPRDAVGLDRYSDFLRGLLDEGKVTMEAIRRRAPTRRVARGTLAMMIRDRLRRLTF
jgi:hypothetical protein